MTHYVVETMYCEHSNFPRDGTLRLSCGHRVRSADSPPGVWLLEGEIVPQPGDTYEMTTRLVDTREYGDRVRRMMEREERKRP